MIIEPNPIWNVLDSSKIEEYMTCPRRFFYRYILGWRPAVKSYHLVFGSAWHALMEHLLITGYRDVPGAIKEFEKVYWTEINEQEDKENAPKNLANAIKGAISYAQKYNIEDAGCKVLYTEVAGSVPLTSEWSIHFKMDSILEDTNGMIFSLEHKTASSFSRQFVDKWTLAVQPNAYNHVLYSLFPEESVWGVKINGAAFFKSKDPDFIRVPVRRSIQMLDSWYANIIEWVGSYYDDLNALSVANTETNSLHCFRQNTTSCTDYFGCSYYPFCISWSNPLRYIDNVPVGFIVEHWDPRKTIEDKAKYKVEGRTIVPLNRSTEVDVKADESFI